MANDQVADGANGLVVAGQLLQSETAEIQKKNIPAAQKAQLLDQSWKKYANSLRNHGVQQATIDVYGALIAKMPEQADMLVKALNDLTKEQLQSVLSLQKKQAELAMSKSDRLADATTGIASFATIISTIARYLGYNEFAESVEAKTKEIMGNVKISLNTDNIGNGLDAGLNNLATNMKARIQANVQDVTRMAQGVANSAPMDIQNAVTPFVSGAAAAGAQQTPQQAAPAASKGVQWKSVEEGLTKDGASVDDRKKVQKLFADVAGVGGDVTSIDSVSESAKLIKAIKAEISLNKYAPSIQTIVNREMHITGNT